MRLYLLAALLIVHFYNLNLAKADTHSKHHAVTIEFDESDLNQRPSDLTSQPSDEVMKAMKVHQQRSPSADPADMGGLIQVDQDSDT